mmetsp:Transcript_68351/g.189967  ORF Transcript_68351/g.189967 Transcript_68351/m.189967 type:complete len:301 (-) Transcript_68351:152-1054(-)
MQIRCLLWITIVGLIIPWTLLDRIATIILEIIGRLLHRRRLDPLLQFFYDMTRSTSTSSPRAHARRVHLDSPAPTHSGISAARTTSGGRCSLRTKTLTVTFFISILVTVQSTPTAAGPHPRPPMLTATTPPPDADANPRLAPSGPSAAECSFYTAPITSNTCYDGCTHAAAISGRTHAPNRWLPRSHSSWHPPPRQHHDTARPYPPELRCTHDAPTPAPDGPESPPNPDADTYPPERRCKHDAPAPEPRQHRRHHVAAHPCPLNHRCNHDAPTPEPAHNHASSRYPAPSSAADSASAIPH